MKNFDSSLFIPQDVNWVKTKPRIAGNQFLSENPVLVKVLCRCLIEGILHYPTTSIIDTYTKPNLVPTKGIWFPANVGLVLTQLTT